MDSKKGTRRVALQKVDILSVNDQGRQRTQARVVLALGDCLFFGRVFVPPDDEEMFRSVALATLEALQAVLQNSVHFVLKNTFKLYPKYLNEPILVVIIDCNFEDLDVESTGACISSEEKILFGIASATLDATNRLVSFLLDTKEMEDGINDF
jgi:hypothetical protein